MNGKIIAFAVIVALLFVYCMSPVTDAAIFEGACAPTVVIDPGHGGMDGGAVGISGIEEKHLNLEISRKLADTLGLFGINTKFTRTADVSTDTQGTTIREKKTSDIKERVKFINKTENAYLISVHLNHFPLSDCKGAQTFCSGDETSKTIADSIQAALRQGVDKTNKRVAQKAGKNIYLLSNITCPGILVECGFLSNAQEEKLLQSENYQEKIALSVAVGFTDALKDVWHSEN